MDCCLQFKTKPTAKAYSPRIEKHRLKNVLLSQYKTKEHMRASPP